MHPMTTNQQPSRSHQPGAAPQRPARIRWWPLAIILIGATAALLWIWLALDTWRQQRILLTAQLLGAALFFLLIWVSAFSRMARPIGLGIVGGFLALVLLGALLLNIRGVTGDLLPIFEWRWKSAGTPSTLETTRPMENMERANGRGDLTADYPQFLGPHRDATLTGLRLARDWNESPPELLWRRPMAPAWSAFSVAGQRAVTQEQQGDQELVTAYDLRSGDRLWTHADTARYATTIAGEGPRASPTIDGRRLYTLGATGILNCLQLETGTLVWSRNILRENDASLLEWGMAGSPLVHDTLVIVSAGGPAGRSLVAYDKYTGARVWSGGDDPAGYSSPRIASFDGFTQILIFNGPGLAAHDPTDGRLLWDFPWAPRHPHVAMPVLVPNDRVLISSGYGSGSALLQVSQSNGTWQVEEVWRSIRLKAKFANVNRIGDFIYGLDDGILVCLDLADGSRRWKDGRYGHGQQILVEDLLLILTERGAVAIIEPNPEALRELAQFQVLHGKTWNPPALAGNLLLVRNDQEAACYRLPLASADPLLASQ
jgi:outer membrane protein assembly factor BamB